MRNPVFLAEQVQAEFAVELAEGYGIGLNKHKMGFCRVTTVVEIINGLRYGHR